MLAMRPRAKPVRAGFRNYPYRRFGAGGAGYRSFDPNHDDARSRGERSCWGKPVEVNWMQRLIPAYFPGSIPFAKRA